MDEIWERGFLPYQLSSRSLPDYPEGRWSRDWKNAASSTGLAPAMGGCLREGTEVTGPAEGKRENNNNKIIRCFYNLTCLIQVLVYVQSEVVT